MTRTQWIRAWRIARLLHTSFLPSMRVLDRSVFIALGMVQRREARSAELGLSLSPTSDK